MFDKILIANRGEIALRIICACKELGIKTVAVHSDVDEESLHVSFADEDVCIGSAKSSESYLNISSIISAAEISNATAIHPGYGFLSENPSFAEICEDCGIEFIGPSPKTMKLMGNKKKALEIMEEAGIPTIPGSDENIEDIAEAKQVAEEIGYPVIFKATAGGGGKGMRVVRRASELKNAFETARSEAEATFDDPSLYLEKFIENPRHIEFQILADTHNRVVHLGERECSIQRNHQKLLEESPSTAVDKELRAKMGNMAKKATREANYVNAGTVEFLLDEEDNFYFIEMNTRIQVEHPVTEFVTGLDLVKEQIKIAAGEKMEIPDKEIKLRGHSIECRINAEKPFSFDPAPGTIEVYHPPGGPGIRVDTAAYENYTVLPYYDSMIAKLISHGRTREEARKRMLRALDVFVIRGIESTVDFHSELLRHEDFIKGNINTGFVEKFFNERE